MTVKIMLVDDHKLFREGLRTLLAEQGDLRVVAEASDGVSAIELAALYAPDVVIMDISMSGMNGIEATGKLLAACPDTRILALSMHLELRLILEMLTAGASGYLLKDCAFEEVEHAVRALAARCPYLSSKVETILLRDFVQLGKAGALPLPVFGEPDSKESDILAVLARGGNASEAAEALHLSEVDAGCRCRRVIFEHVAPMLHLIHANGGEPAAAASMTVREKEILAWVKEGKSTWEIASIVGLSQDTVKYHLRNIFLKLNVTNRSQAVAVAIDNKLI